MPQPAGRARRVLHTAPPIVAATDLRGSTVLKRGGVFLLTDQLGDVVPDERGLGMYVGDTRMLSRLTLLVGGERPSVLRPDGDGAGHGPIVMTNPELPQGQRPAASTGEPLAARSLGIVRERHLDRGLHERLAISNYADHPATLTVDLVLDADMADIFEVRGFVRPRRGDRGPTHVRGDTAAFEYRALDGRQLRTRVVAPGAQIRPAPRGIGGVRARWRPRIAPGARADLEWSVLPELPVAVAALETVAGICRATEIRSDSPALDRIVARGIADLDLLLTPGPGAGQRFIAAGIPWFTALFGRDAILASFGALIVDPGLAIDTLRVLASLQATTDDPTVDAEPGKIPHEVRNGEMARTGEVPFGRYYGSADATPLWLILLGETFDWTGDLDLVEGLWPNALAALDWVESHGDLDGDGFIEYRRRAPGGLIQHGWKDAPDAIRDRHGRVAEGPIALAEVQGYAYDARVRMARLARALGDAVLARRLEKDAGRLRDRFEAAFWVPDRMTYALALDGLKRPMDAIGSNQGHALWSGIVSGGHAAAVAANLTGSDLDSGWGLRTFAAGQRGYSPLGYHTGSVWPHDTAVAVAGLRRAGFDAQASQLAGELLGAAQTFPDGRLPELFCGFGRNEVGPPVPYPTACAPQAWAAAAPLMILRALLGMRPRAAEHRLDLERPRLPAGLATLTLSGLRIGDARVDLRCHRLGGSTRVEVSSVTGDLRVAVLA